MKLESPQIIDQQLDLLDQQGRSEKWQRDHDDVTLCRNFEDLIALALETLGRIRKRCDSEPADTIFAYYRRWHAMGLQVEESLQWLERRGYEVDRSDQFRFALNAASMAENADQIAAAFERLASGQGRPLDEILDELSHQA